MEALVVSRTRITTSITSSSRRTVATGRGHQQGDPSREVRNGRFALRRSDDRHIRSARAHAAWIGKAVNGAGTVANVIGGVLALALIVYLFIALIRPEKF